MKDIIYCGYKTTWENINNTDYVSLFDKIKMIQTFHSGGGYIGT